MSPFLRRFLCCLTKNSLPISWLDSIQLSIFIEESQFSFRLHRHQNRTKKDKNYNWWWSYFPLWPCPWHFFHCFQKFSRPIHWIHSLQIPIFIVKLQFLCHLHHHKKNWKNQKLQLMLKLLSAIPLPPTLHLSLPMMLPTDTLSRQSPTLHIHWEIVINMSKLPPTPKKTEKHENWRWRCFLLSPCPLLCFHCFPKGLCTISWIYSLQIPIFVEKSQYLCHLHHRQKNRKIQKLQLIIELLSTIPLPPMIQPSLPTMLPPDPLYLQSPTPHNHW